MSIDSSAMIIVGLPFNELGNKDIQYIEDNGLDICSPYFDAELKHCIVGITISQTMEYDFNLLNMEEVQEKIKSAKHIFKLTVGKEAEVFLGPNIT